VKERVLLWVVQPPTTVEAIIPVRRGSRKGLRKMWGGVGLGRMRRRGHVQFHWKFEGCRSYGKWKRQLPKPSGDQKVELGPYTMELLPLPG